MIFKKNNINYNTRKAHRYLGLFIGIQFLFWTLGGLYFSWNNMDDVHGDTLLKHERTYFKDLNFATIQKGIDRIKLETKIDSTHSIRLIDLFGKPVAQYRYFEKGQVKLQLINATDGSLKAALTEKECLELVKGKLATKTAITKTTLLEKNSTGKHHEYRGRPLPAYVFELDHYSNTTIYVSTEQAQVMAVRNTNWRIFDFMWMLHTMDYDTRDHITNWVLRIFSVLGLVTIFSGFYLFFLTSPTLKKLRGKKKQK
ncbi:MAG: hypothetical protein COB98_06565 [Flavobacteriaceae bacterium]|nr:MAG: hypothetical protein COB98_06565 [Flavobacteriaceae bacterium]